MIFYPPKSGFVHVVTGGMFSGKTEELIRIVKRAKIAKQGVMVFKPAMDTRYDENDVISHSKNYFQATPLKKIEDIYQHDLSQIDLIGIDEAQFFGEEIVDIVNQLANSGKRVVIAGLDLDYRGVPFGSMPKLIATAEYVEKMHAICTVCGNPASRSQRITNSKELVVLGADTYYEPRCRLHFNSEGGENAC